MINFVMSINEFMFIGFMSLIVFFIFSKWKSCVSPVVAAMLVGIILLVLTHPLNFSETKVLAVLPSIKIPSFSFTSFLSVSIPLALLVLSNDAAVGIGALEQNDYNPHIKEIIVYSGVFTIMAGFFGGQSANIGGMMSALCADEEAGAKDIQDQ